MKREKWKLCFVYILLFVVFALVIYLIYFMVGQENSGSKELKTLDEGIVFEVPSECVFVISMSGFNSVVNKNGDLSICDGYNKFTINDIVLSGSKIELSVIYYNGVSTSGNDGVFIGDKKIIDGASLSNFSNFGVFDNMLYIKNWTDSNVNILVYNNYGTEVYNLVNSLNNFNITDLVFSELSKTDSSIKVVLDSDNLDPNSFSFGSGGFSFNSDTGKACVTGQNYKGSSYKVIYNGVFSSPTFVNYVGC